MPMYVSGYKSGENDLLMITAGKDVSDVPSSYSLWTRIYFSICCEDLLLSCFGFLSVRRGFPDKIRVEYLFLFRCRLEDNLYMR